MPQTTLHISHYLLTSPRLIQKLSPKYLKVKTKKGKGNLAYGLSLKSSEQFELKDLYLLEIKASQEKWMYFYLFSDHKNVATSSYLTRHLSATWRFFSCLWNVIQALIPTKAWQTGVRIWAVCNSHNIWLSTTGGGWHMVSVNWSSRF